MPPIAVSTIFPYNPNIGETNFSINPVGRRCKLKTGLEVKP